MQYLLFIIPHSNSILVLQKSEKRWCTGGGLHSSLLYGNAFFFACRLKAVFQITAAAAAAPANIVATKTDTLLAKVAMGSSQGDAFLVVLLVQDEA